MERSRELDARVKKQCRSAFPLLLFLFSIRSKLRNLFSMTAREALVALNMVSHVGPVRLRQLLQKFGDPVAVLSAKKSALLSVDGINEVTADAISTWESTIDLAGEVKR